MSSGYAQIRSAAAIALTAAAEHERLMLRHEQNRQRTEERRRAELIAYARRLRVAGPPALEVRGASAAEVRLAVDEAISTNGEWEAKLAEEQTEVNSRVAELAAAMPRHDLLLGWAKLAEVSVQVHETPPTFPELSAADEAERQVQRIREEISVLVAALKASQREIGEAQSGQRWQAIRMAEVSEEQRTAEQPWRVALSRKLKDELTRPGPVGELPAAVLEAFGLLSGVDGVASDRTAVTDAVNGAIRSLEGRRRAGATVKSCLTKLEELSKEATQLDSDLFLQSCDSAREEFEARQAAHDPEELDRWWRTEARRLENIRAQVRRAHVTDLERRTARLLEQFYESACKMVEELGYLQVGMETVVPKDGRLVSAGTTSKTQGRLFRQPGSATYGKLVELAEDGKLSFRPVRLAGPDGLPASDATGDERECERQSVENEEKVLALLAAELRGLAPDRLTGLDPIIDSGHRSFDGLETAILGREVWDKVVEEVRAERGEHGGPLEMQIRR